MDFNAIMQFENDSHNPHKGKAGSCVPAYLGGYVASLRVY